jgi:hypothetical protein
MTSRPTRSERCSSTSTRNSAKRQAPKVQLRDIGVGIVAGDQNSSATEGEFERRPGAMGRRYRSPGPTRTAPASEGSVPTDVRLDGDEMAADARRR